MTHHQLDPHAGAPAAIVRHTSGRILGALVGISVFTIALATTSSHPAALLAQSGDGNADTDNNGVNAEIAELQSTVAELESALGGAQSDLVDTQAALLGAQSDLAKALLAIDELRAAQQQMAEALTSVAVTLQHVRVHDGEMNGLAGPHLIIEGCNVHVRSGSGSTEEGGVPTGLGNLIVGYNEIDDAGSRGGAHNLVVGPNHTYSSVGGLVAGSGNTITAPAASVTGGFDNIAEGPGASVCGGENNAATLLGDVVSGGRLNRASGGYATVAGGQENLAGARDASVSGGYMNVAVGELSAISGGEQNRTVGRYAVVSGGLRNVAYGDASTVSGGALQFAQDDGEHLP